jgi:competence protein ComEA
MNQTKSKTWWLYPIVILIVAIIVGGAILVSQHSFGGSQPLEITLPESSSSPVEVYISGEVNNPGSYPFSQDSRLREIWQKGGGLTEEADLDNIRLEILSTDESSIKPPQKINLNTAEPWLLEALYGIGDTKAQNIVRYREEHGDFKQIEDLMKVPGIAEGIFGEIKDKITV